MSSISPPAPPLRNYDAERAARRREITMKRLATMREHGTSSGTPVRPIRMHVTPWFTDEHGNRTRQIWALEN